MQNMIQIYKSLFMLGFFISNQFFFKANKLLNTINTSKIDFVFDKLPSSNSQIILALSKYRNMKEIYAIKLRIHMIAF